MTTAETDWVWPINEHKVTWMHVIKIYYIAMQWVSVRYIPRIMQIIYILLCAVKIWFYSYLQGPLQGYYAITPNPVTLFSWIWINEVNGPPKYKEKNKAWVTHRE